jgi:glutamyl-Q tRNA(Asp) synthetase
VITGRFAPSPTGPLHLGSLVAAVGSWIYARRAGGRWLVRMEDIDTPRVVPGSADEILAALTRYGLHSDAPIVWQSRRTNLYEDALATLRARGLAYDCGCSRGEGVYPGTCRDGLPAGRVARSVRFRVPDEVIAFDDLLHGRVEENVARTVGDFVIKRADGLFAYQLAVVVDDAEQSVTQVVRGADLLSSTGRQIALQRALGLPTPTYAHLPLVLNEEGEKLSKRDGALALPTLDERRVRETLELALRFLGTDFAEFESLAAAATASRSNS